MPSLIVMGTLHIAVLASGAGAAASRTVDRTASASARMRSPWQGVAEIANAPIAHNLRCGPWPVRISVLDCEQAGLDELARQGAHVVAQARLGHVGILRLDGG